MSADFIKLRLNAENLRIAAMQQTQLRYFTESKVQPEIRESYIENWAQSRYQTNDYFLNWIKNILRTPNFLSFFKYMRHPLPSARLINDEISPMLKRVFHAEDSYFEYTYKDDVYTEMPNFYDDDFENRAFNAYLFSSNNVIIHDLEDVNEPYRFMLDIDKVISVDSKNNRIKRIAYIAKTKDENGSEIDGYAYIDSEKYAFYDKEYRLVKEAPHDLGICPATWVSNEAFSTDNDVVRKSPFSYVREELEEYVFLKTLRKMAEVNGAIPISVSLKASKNSDKSGKDVKRDLEQTPNTSNAMSSQSATFGSEVTPSNSVMQVGTEITIPQVKKADGTIDTDVIQNFARFYYIPVECLEFIDKTIDKTERSIISNALGDYNQSNDSAKNEDQVFYSFNNKQDKLRALSLALTWVRTKSDYFMMALKYGKENVKVDLFYGSDFFLDTESELLSRLKDAPNQIERRNILKRVNHIRYRFNTTKRDRVDLLYSIIPFTTDADFVLALNQNLVDEQTKKLQLQFDYYVTKFESLYGDIYRFFLTLDGEDSQKLILIKNLMFNLINQTNE
jgi:hypothetical protein